MVGGGRSIVVVIPLLARPRPPHCNLTDYLSVYWCKCNCAGLTDSSDAFLKMLEYLPFTTTRVCSSLGGWVEI